MNVVYSRERPLSTQLIVDNYILANNDLLNPSIAISMSANRDKPRLWKEDIALSVDAFNEWFIQFAPKAYRDSRERTTHDVERALHATKNLSAITPDAIRKQPHIVQALRMATCPPLARDRLAGLASVKRTFLTRLEQKGIPVRMSEDELNAQLSSICEVLHNMLDRDIFPWLMKNKRPTTQERYRASTIVADRLCGAISDPIVRNAQEQRQLARIKAYLERKGYRQQALRTGEPLKNMTPGTFCFRTNVRVEGGRDGVNMPIDVIIQPKRRTRNRLPLLIEAKSAGDFTNTNKRRKEEAKKMEQLRTTFGVRVRYALFLCGYFDSGYLGYEAAEGIDWIWEHRIDDFEKLGV